MTVSEASKEILRKEPRIRFIGTLKDGIPNLTFNENFKIDDENNVKLSIRQTYHIIEEGKRITDLGNLESIVFEYENMKLFNMSLNEETITFGTNTNINNQEILRSVSNHIMGIPLQDSSASSIKETKESSSKTKDRIDQPIKSNFTDPWQRYLSTLIELWKETTITSIHTYERILIEFWKNSTKQRF